MNPTPPSASSCAPPPTGLTPAPGDADTGRARLDADADWALAKAVDLPPELLHGIETVVSTARDPRARAAVIMRIVNEVHATMAWAHHSSIQAAEFTSLQQILHSADSHVQRVQQASPASGDPIEGSVS